MTIERVLVGAAIVLGALAAAIGSPLPPRVGTLDVNQVAGIIAREEDHVTAIELGEWLRAKKDGLRVIDVRSVESYDAYHIPRAEDLPLASLARADFKRTETVVLYSDGGAHAAQAWVLLRALGLTQVYVLRGGLDEWLDDVINPVIAANPSIEEREAFKKTEELSRFFGGSPRVGERTTGSSTAEAVARLKRRGC